MDHHLGDLAVVPAAETLVAAAALAATLRKAAAEQAARA
jgi:hypothetical protein